jgi:hypothetical protein
MDLFLWGYMKALIYTSPVHSEEARIARIFVTAAIWLFERPRQSLLCRCRLCIEDVGHIFEYLL